MTVGAGGGVVAAGAAAGAVGAGSEVLGTAAAAGIGGGGAALFVTVGALSRELARPLTAWLATAGAAFAAGGGLNE
ncbi:MAG: hypothetical protein ACLP01_09310 [Solirubrobacteraceae bacterium]